jgi:hypothetical protein
MLKWKLITVRLEMVLNLIQDKCTVCAKHTIGSEIILDTPMELLGYDAQVEAHFGQLVDSANHDKVHDLRQTYHRLGNRFGCIRWNS